MPRTPMLVFPAVVFPAGMSFSMAMVAAVYIGIICQYSFSQCPGCVICTAGNTAVKLDSRFSQRILCTAADTAAD